MRGRSPTKQEKRFMDDLCQIGCVACRVSGFSTPLVSPHHIDGKTKPGAHFNTIPLCGKHHQEPDTHKPKRWISRHGDGRAAFEREYGKEEDLRQLCLEIMDYEKVKRSIL